MVLFKNYCMFKQNRLRQEGEINGIIYLIYSLILFALLPAESVRAQCLNVNIDNTCTQYQGVCSSTDFINGCGGSSGWSSSHGTPQLNYMPPQTGIVKAPGYYYLQIVADNSGSEGVYIPFTFVSQQTYNVYLNLSTTGNGLINCYAANGLTQHQNPKYTGTTFYGCQAAVESISSKQYIGQAANTSSAVLSFTANSNFSQLWFYTTFSGGTTFNGMITGIQVCAVCNVGTPNGLTTSNNEETLNWSPVTGISYYLVTVSDTHAGTTTTRTYSSPTNSLNYCALSSGDLVSFSVQGVCANGTSMGSSSSAYSFTTAYPNLPAPTQVTYTPPSTLSWQPVAGTNSYLVTVKNLTSGGTGAYPVTGTSVSGSSAELSTGASYQVSVSSSSGCVYGTPSIPITFTVPSCSPPTVSNVEGGTYVNLYPVSNAVSYNVGWRNTSGTIVYQINNIGPIITTAGYQATGVPHGSFYIVAQANCSNGATTAWGSPYFGGVQTTSIRLSANLTSTLETGDGLQVGPEGVTLSPNPSGSQVNVLYNSNRNSTAEVVFMDVLGSERIRKKVAIQVGRNIFTFRIDQLGSGIYFIKVIDGTKIFVNRLAVQK
jgi:hypothetical protein